MTALRYVTLRQLWSEQPVDHLMRVGRGEWHTLCGVGVMWWYVGGRDEPKRRRCRACYGRLLTRA